MKILDESGYLIYPVDLYQGYASHTDDVRAHMPIIVLYVFYARTGFKLEGLHLPYTTSFAIIFHKFLISIILSVRAYRSTKFSLREPVAISGIYILYSRAYNNDALQIDHRSHFGTCLMLR